MCSRDSCSRCFFREALRNIVFKSRIKLPGLGQGSSWRPVKAPVGITVISSRCAGLLAAAFCLLAIPGGLLHLDLLGDVLSAAGYEDPLAKLRLIVYYLLLVRLQGNVLSIYLVHEALKLAMLGIGSLLQHW